MQVTILERETAEAEAHFLRVAIWGLELEATWFGALPHSDHAQAEAGFEDVLACSPARDDDPRGVWLDAEGDLLLCAEVSRVFPDGGCDLLVEGERLALDADELHGVKPQPGRAMRLRLRGLVLVA